VRSKNEQTDLPPFEPIPPILPTDELRILGRVVGIVDALVISQSISGLPLDENTVVCLKDDPKTTGRIYETFGPVSSPFYAIRFTEKIYMPLGTEIMYVARLSTFVLPEIIQDKGSDASGNYDEEPPENDVEYSDDEAEMDAKKRSNSKNKKRKAGPKSLNPPNKFIVIDTETNEELGEIELDEEYDTQDTPTKPPPKKSNRKVKQRNPKPKQYINQIQQNINQQQPPTQYQQYQPHSNNFYANPNTQLPPYINTNMLQSISTFMAQQSAIQNGAGGYQTMPPNFINMQSLGAIPGIILNPNNGTSSINHNTQFIQGLPSNNVIFSQPPPINYNTQLTESVTTITAKPKPNNRIYKK